MQTLNLPLVKDDYKPERTSIRDNAGFTIAENVLQKDADTIIQCCNVYYKIQWAIKEIIKGG